MIQPTLADILAKVDDDLDLEDEIMITADEKVKLVNAAVNRVEKLITTVYEDYFLQKASLALTTDEDEYDFPTNIIAHKIRKVFYSSDSEKYEIKRIRRLTDTVDIESDDLYRYLVLTTDAGEFKINLFPPSRETSASNVTIWYLGNANVLADDADIMNIPEAFDLVVELTKLSCAKKEGHPIQASIADEVMVQEKLFIDLITAMIPDEDNEIELQPSDVDYYDLC